MCGKSHSTCSGTASGGLRPAQPHVALRLCAQPRPRPPRLPAPAPPGQSGAAGCSTRSAPPGPRRSSAPAACPAPAREGTDRPGARRRNVEARWRCPGTGTRGAAQSRAGVAARGRTRLQGVGDVGGPRSQRTPGQGTRGNSRGSRSLPGSRGCSVKHWSGSRPSAWQNCWTWLAAFWGRISTTSPAAKLCGKATGLGGPRGLGG